VKVLLIVIDAASPRVFCPAVQTGRLKHLQRLADAGSMHQASVSIFPSITPAATAAIITGAYPAENGIIGAAWFDEASNQVAYYGDDMWVAAREGFGPFLRDFLVHLNGDRLVAPTLFDMVEESGGQAACLNYLIYKGAREHKVNIPWLLAMLPGVPLAETVRGPSTLCLGDFVSDGKARHRGPDAHGPLHRFGMDDAGTASLLCKLAAAGALPEFTVAYFADNDYRSHEVGPHAALPVLDGVDAALGAFFEASGGLERLLADTCIFVTSDHGHCEIGPNASESVIGLSDLFADFRQAKLGSPWSDRDEILICPNMRAAQIYVRHPDQVEFVARAAARDRRVDQVMWRLEPRPDGQTRYRVIGPTGELTFWRASEDSNAARDAFGGTWAWDGEPAILGLDVTDRCVESLNYPNPFERIVGALDAVKSGPVWLTARPGCEFQVQGGGPHPGGASHGALHALDSLSPLIAAGPVRLPRHMRSVDLAPLCLQVLGRGMRYAVGQSRASLRAFQEVGD
jgi:hypothetical protein